MVYTFLLVLGILGYATLVALGFAGGHGHRGAGPRGHVGGRGSHAHGKASLHAKGSAHGKSSAGAKTRAWSSLISFSPLDLFSLAIGGGLTGKILERHVPSAFLVAIAAVAGALAFTIVLVKPLTRMILQFASTPSLGLEGTVAEFAAAETTFDAASQGIVTVTVDGQICRMLATLADEEKGTLVRRGDRLIVLDVDAKKGSCRVSAELI